MLKQPVLLALVMLLCCCGLSRAAEEMDVFLQYPSFSGDFYAVGEMSFPPAAVPAGVNLAVRSSSPNEEVPARVNVLQSWPDGSVMSAEIMFPAGTTRKRQYIVVYGENVTRTRELSQTAALQTVVFSVAGAARTSENLDLEAGSINIRVDENPGSQFVYYWYLIPIAAMIWLTYVRARRGKVYRSL